MTHQEYLDKCQQLRSLANEMEQYARLQSGQWEHRNDPMDYHQVRNYGNLQKAILALGTIGKLTAFDLHFLSFEDMNV